MDRAAFQPYRSHTYRKVEAHPEENPPTSAISRGTLGFGSSMKTQ